MNEAQDELKKHFKQAYFAFLETKFPRLTRAEIEQAKADFAQGKVRHILITDLDEIQYLTEREANKHKKENEK